MPIWRSLASCGFSSSVTLEEAQAELAMWQGALEAILGGAQSYQIGGGDSTRILTRANLAEVKKGRDEARRNVEALTSGRAPGVRVVRAIPRDL